jgi:hypothetical protein
VCTHSVQVCALETDPLCTQNVQGRTNIFVPGTPNIQGRTQKGASLCTKCQRRNETASLCTCNIYRRSQKRFPWAREISRDAHRKRRPCVLAQSRDPPKTGFPVTSEYPVTRPKRRPSARQIFRDAPKKTFLCTHNTKGRTQKWLPYTRTICKKSPKAQHVFKHALSTKAPKNGVPLDAQYPGTNPIKGVPVHAQYPGTHPK